MLFQENRLSVGIIASFKMVIDENDAGRTIDRQPVGCDAVAVRVEYNDGGEKDDASGTSSIATHRGRCKHLRKKSMLHSAVGLWLMADIIYYEMMKMKW